MLKFLTSFGASTAFEKNRLILTAQNLDAPEEHLIKSNTHFIVEVIKTFEGEDDETRSQIAFATIIKKIHISEGR